MWALIHGCCCFLAAYPPSTQYVQILKGENMCTTKTRFSCERRNIKESKHVIFMSNRGLHILSFTAEFTDIFLEQSSVLVDLYAFSLLCCWRIHATDLKLSDEMQYFRFWFFSLDDILWGILLTSKDILSWVKRSISRHLRVACTFIAFSFGKNAKTLYIILTQANKMELFWC